MPFQFKVVHASGRTMGMADNLSRHPSENNSKEQKIKAETLWNNWYIVNEKTEKLKLFQQMKSHFRKTAINQ